MANSFAVRSVILALAFSLSVLLSRAAEIPDNLLTNGGFEAGLQIWKGDGQIVLLPDGNHVCEVEASKSRMKDIKQQFHMRNLQQVEIVFRARSLGYDGPGIRISVHQPGSGFIFWNKELPADGTWGDYRVKYTRTNANMDLRELVISTLLGSGKVQFDDIEVREPGKTQGNQPPDSASVPAPAPSAVPTPSRAALPAPAGGFNSLQDLVNSAPPEALQKLHDSTTVNEAIEQLNAYFAQNVKSKPVLLPIKANITGPATDGHNVFRVGAYDTLVPTAGDGLNVRLWAYFPPATAPANGQVVRGTDVTVSGVIGRCDITGPAGLRLNIDLQQAKIEVP